MFPTEPTEQEEHCKGWKLTVLETPLRAPLASWPNAKLRIAKLSLMSDECRCGHRSMGEGQESALWPALTRGVDSNLGVLRQLEQGGKLGSLERKGAWVWVWVWVWTFQGQSLCQSQSQSQRAYA
jgi:hypothetical protein